MTISTSRTAERTVDSIVWDAYSTAGLVTPDLSSSTPMYQQRILYGRRLLNDILDELQASGVLTKFAYFDYLTLTANLETYTMSSYVIDIVGDGKYIPAGTAPVTRADGETLVVQVTIDDWHRISSRSSSGNPTKFLCDKSGALVTVRLWPIPAEAGTIRFVVHRSSADADTGLATVELPQYFMSYLRFRLAYELAMTNALPPARCEQLRAEADSLKKTARGAANSQVSGTLNLIHPTPWS